LVVIPWEAKTIKGVARHAHSERPCNFEGKPVPGYQAHAGQGSGIEKKLKALIG